MTTSDRARRQLHALAREVGIEVRWRAYDGTPRTCSDDTLLATLAMLRVDVRSPADAGAARREWRARRRTTLIEPVAVAWDGAAPVLPVRVRTRDADARLAVAVHDDRGEERRWDRRELRITSRAIDDDIVELGVELPHGFESGRYRVIVEHDGQTGDATLLAAPSRIPRPTRERAWGVFAPLYALHDRDRTTTGDLATLERFAGWIAARGGRVVGTLPMLAAFLGHGDEPCDPSPYAPASRQFWNELYLDLGALPELADEPQPVDPAPGPLADLPKLAAVRRPLLERAAATIAGTRRDALVQWLQRNPGATDYARFRAEVEGSGDAGERMHEYAQWSMASQLDALRREFERRDQSLYLDLPVGTHRDGYDVASRGELFVRDASVGAPPDEFQEHGQDWGFPPIDPHAARAGGYAYLDACLSTQLRYARALRIDHVMGLHRLWMIAPGAAPAEGAYVHYAAEEQWAVVTLAAARAGATIVGEDLGTVPPETVRALRRHRALGMWVVQFEMPQEPRTPARAPARSALACLDTHDLPTFATWWSELDRDARAPLLDALRAAGELDDDDGAPDTEKVLDATLGWLGRSSAPLVLATLEDLWLEREAQNVPGPSGPNANFRRRIAHGLSELDALDSVKRALERLDRTRRRRS